MIRRLLLYVLIAAPALSGADKTADKTLELLREMGGLQDQIKALQKSLEGKFAELGQGNAEQARASAEQAVKATAALGDRLAKGLQDQQDQQTRTSTAVAALSSQLQAVAGDLSTLREAMNDLTASLVKISTQLSDLSNIVKSAQAAKPDAPAPATPEISGTDLFASADGDRLGGKFDLALQEYTQFVTKFGTWAQAPDAQYYIGSILYSNQQWEDAVKAFDLLLRTYPDNKSRAASALYYKGDSLARLGRWEEADAALRDLRKRFPTSPLSKQSLAIKPPH
jgi:TolA-binding protein